MGYSLPFGKPIIITFSKEDEASLYILPPQFKTSFI